MTMPTSVARPVSSLAGAALRAVGRDSELTAASVLMLSRKGSYSIEKARRVLGFEPRIDLDEGLARSEAWAREAGLLG
jgi:nucleoside-diphosphate-sugar epimerase